MVLTGCNSFHNLHKEFRRSSLHMTKEKASYHLKTRVSFNIQLRAQTMESTHCLFIHDLTAGKKTVKNKPV